MRVATFSEFETHSGALVDLLLPEAADISFWDIATSLAGTCRFSGHVRPQYVNAQHSVVVASYLADEDRIHGLLHDAHEYVLGDMGSPVKAALAHICPDFPRALRYLERSIERAIYEKAGVERPDDEARARVKRADMIALATEQRDIVRSPNVWNLPFPPANRKIVPVDADAARMMYLDALAECGVDVGFSRAA